jgi:hypothetical protein
MGTVLLVAKLLLTLIFVVAGADKPQVGELRRHSFRRSS